ncbi:MAG: hypothetical protein RL595_2691 [Planctomycetota bacterium]
MPFSKLTSTLLVLFALALTGCGGSPKESSLPTDPTYLALEKIGNAYIRIAPPPQQKAELVAALKGFGKPEEILKSPNDGHEFIIVYGVKLQMLKATANEIPVVAFEKFGKDGKRYVLRGRNGITQLTDAELREAKFPDGYKLPF